MRSGLRTAKEIRTSKAHTILSALEAVNDLVSFAAFIRVVTQRSSPLTDDNRYNRVAAKNSYFILVRAHQRSVVDNNILAFSSIII